MLSLIKRELRSRKYRAVIVGSAAATLGEMGWIQNVWAWVALVAAYILGVAYEDAGKVAAPVADKLLPPSA